MENDHKKESQEQEQKFLNLMDRQKEVKDEINKLEMEYEKEKKISQNLMKYYNNILKTLNSSHPIDYFSSYSIFIIPSNEGDKNTEIIENAYDSTTEKSSSIMSNQINANDQDLDRDNDNDNDDDSNSNIFILDMDGSNSVFSSSSLSSIYNINGNHSNGTSQAGSIKQKSNSFITNPLIENLKIKPQTNSPGEFPKSKPRTNINSQFITFNLQNERIKRKNQLLEENKILSEEIKKNKIKNFNLGEELFKVRQENEQLKTKLDSMSNNYQELETENQKLLAIIEELKKEVIKENNKNLN